MEELEKKLNKLYTECIEDLKKIGIDIYDKELDIGEIDIHISKRNNKRYGCCKQEEPDLRYKHIERKGYRRVIKYEKFNKHNIEISKWVLELNDELIKDTIMHEIIHCFPYCNNHGKKFKYYAKYINEHLGYNISRVGNREKDCEKSGIELKKEEKEYKYKLVCTECGQEFNRKRLKKDFIKKYRCGKCKGKLSFVESNNKK